MWEESWEGHNNSVGLSLGGKITANFFLNLPT